MSGRYCLPADKARRANDSMLNCMIWEELAKKIITNVVAIRPEVDHNEGPCISNGLHGDFIE